MNPHGKKILAPILVTVIMVAYYAVYFGLLLTAIDDFWRWVLGIAPLLLAVFTIKVCIERIREIKKGEEDDLSQY